MDKDERYEAEAALWLTRAGNYLGEAAWRLRYLERYSDAARAEALITLLHAAFPDTNT